MFISERDERHYYALRKVLLRFGIKSAKSLPGEVIITFAGTGVQVRGTYDVVHSSEGWLTYEE